jgi:hypothetical protein
MLRRGGHAVALGLLTVAGAVMRGRPVPVPLASAIRRLVPVEDAMVPRRKSYRGQASRLRNRGLGELLGDVELGGWTLSAGEIDFLETVLVARKPDLVLEFGSGISTASLAYLMRELHETDSRVLVVSVDEDERFAAETRHILLELGLSKHAVVVPSPVVEQVVEGRRTRCYELPSEKLEEVVGSRRADFVLVDGPSLGSGGSRFATIPLARPLIASARRSSSTMLGGMPSSPSPASGGAYPGSRFAVFTWSGRGCSRRPSPMPDPTDDGRTIPVPTGRRRSFPVSMYE